MLGIPTRSDVKDRKYQRIIDKKNVEDKLHIFSWPTWSGVLHNHIVDAKRVAKELDKGYKQYLDPKSVLDYYIGDINQFRDNLALALKKGYIRNKKTWMESTGDINHHLNGRERKRLLNKELVKYRPRKLGVLEPDTPKSVWYKPSTWFPGWQPQAIRYRWNPVELFNAEFDDYERELINAYNSSENPIKQLKRMDEVIETFNDSANKELISDIIEPDSRSAFGMERKAGTRAYKVNQKHRAIAGNSDLYLRFDESYVVIGEYQIPSNSMLNEDTRFNSNNLQYRQMIRDLLAELVESKGSFVFNGITYIPVLQDDKIKQYMSNDITSQEFVNLLGVPVMHESGGEIHPDSWASEEFMLVNQYRMGEAGTDRELLERYSGFGGDCGISSDREKLEHLKRILQKTKSKTSSGAGNL